ncbi:MAG: hypothetical protein Satyrvirus4_21 [Satyrvirus sp.]|uniref:Uncharacterized protein n=1 Tax=Satyrvirus sp. TaxID=2487771 RepID=A0A3G5AEW3_9VIRU|nr:MAG: hypothetical protein Satyrvirus4_21 [Satyrvirus sp.]
MDKDKILELLTPIVRTTIVRVYMHPVTFQLYFQDENVGRLWLNEIDFDGDDFNEEEINFLGKIKWNTVIDENIKTATGYSKQNGNDDSRGGGCGNLGIPVEDFSYTITNETGITIKNITEIVYRLKGSKYDWWYELFDCINIDKVTNDSMLFEVTFGYGS